MSQEQTQTDDGRLQTGGRGAVNFGPMTRSLEIDRELEDRTRVVGEELAARFPAPRRLPRPALERRLERAMGDDPELRAALFRFVDVRPTCRGWRDVSRHLGEFLAEADTSRAARRGASLAKAAVARRLVAAVAAAGVRQMAGRFIIGEDAPAAVPAVARLWTAGAAATVDLLGEATVTEEEADAYAARCAETIEALRGAATSWSERPLLEADGIGPIPRVNLSVKVSALTPLLRAQAPERGIAGAEVRLRALMRAARDAGAHLHVDMESFDSREAVTELTLRLLAEPEFEAGPSAGIVLQAYLTESPAHLEHLLEWARRHRRADPLTVRIVKGAYWDHETVQAVQHGWSSPVFEDRRACDRNFERLSRVLIDAQPTVRAAVGSHNLRSVAHAIAYADLSGSEVELQVLRGLGDDLQEALLACGRRVRAYCPIGDLVAGMAYLVRRLLENTSNDSFLRARAEGVELSTLLEAP